jgi:hypothetical protein
VKADVKQHNHGFGARFFASMDSLLIATVVTLACGLVAALAEYGTHIAVAHMSARQIEIHAAVDATAIGLVTVTLIGSLIVLVRVRRRMVVEELARVAELNHNVRNALQVIRHSHTLERDEQAEAIVASVDRIDETLRRLFPALRTAEVASNTARSRLVRSMDVPRQPQSKNDTTSSANSHSDE